jgi:hypothetical protein
MHIAFLELLQETWIVAESTKTKNAFETASGNCARVLDHAAFCQQDRGLKARQAAHKQKRGQERTISTDSRGLLNPCTVMTSLGSFCSDSFVAIFSSASSTDAI